MFDEKGKLKTMMNKPKLGITMGDPASIGPEIAAKTFSEKYIYNLCKPILIGDSKVLKNTLSLLKSDLNVNEIYNVEDAKYEHGTIDLYNLSNVDIQNLEMGKISAMCGDAAFQNVTTAIKLALNNDIDGTVTGPLHKESINLAGHKYSGHTEIYAEYTGTKKYAMLLVEEDMRVIHVSTHVSLREACDLVKKDRIIEVIELMNDACKQFGIAIPRIGVAGLNPHASDGGLFGDEEVKEILPAIEDAYKMGYNVSGPVPADTLFAKAKGGAFDGCVAMYHDQGHIPFKLTGFEWDKETQKMKSVTGVNITLGLPIIRTSVDHGTAFEIAGKGIASPDALILAIEYAAKMANHRIQQIQSTKEGK
jgi:4-hydroxythreonine-4-phosphate dehydrogenase